MKDATNIIVIVEPWVGRLQDRRLFHQLINDLRREGFLPTPYPHVHPHEYEKSLWEWKNRSQHLDYEEWEYWLDRWERHEWEFHKRYRSEFLYCLNRLSPSSKIDQVIFLALFRDNVEQLHELILADIPAEVVYLNLGEAYPSKERLSGSKLLNYPEDRSELLNFLVRFLRDGHDDEPQVQRLEHRDDLFGIQTLDPSDGHDDEPPIRRRRLEENYLPSLPMYSRQAAKRNNLPDNEMPNEVHLGASVPRDVSPSEKFVARFAAYTEANRSEIHRILKLESPSSQRRLDLDKCQWHPGTRVTVRLEANDANVLVPVQTFNWNGDWKIIRFDVEVNEVVASNNLILKFDIAVEGLPIMSLRPELEVLERNQHRNASVKPSFVEKAAPKSAFASYAGTDRREVLGRVRSLQIFTGIDVFVDCLSLRPGNKWKEQLGDEIKNRDIFWLFWSRSAMVSEWVEWEWRTALALKSLAGIQPHPLEPLELAPPPIELSDLQFGNMYEWYISQLRTSWLTSQLRIFRHRVTSVLHRLIQSAGPKSPLRVRLATLLAMLILIGAICAGLFVWIRS